MGPWSIKSSPSRLLSLPAEIRGLIFEFAVSSPSTVAFRLGPYERESYKEATQPALTRVSRQVRHESLPIYYECNDFVLHSERPKADDAKAWLECNEPHLRDLRRLSYWVRHVTLTHHRTSSSGAICISLVRPKKNDEWVVDEHWKWITVCRKPAGLDEDVEFLLRNLKDLTAVYLAGKAEPHDYDAVMTDLRKRYVEEKML